MSGLISRRTSYHNSSFHPRPFAYCVYCIITHCKLKCLSYLEFLSVHLTDLHQGTDTLGTKSDKITLLHLNGVFTACQGTIISENFSIASLRWSSEGRICSWWDIPESCPTISRARAWSAPAACRTVVAIARSEWNVFGQNRLHILIHPLQGKICFSRRAMIGIRIFKNGSLGLWYWSRQYNRLISLLELSNFTCPLLPKMISVSCILSCIFTKKNRKCW